MDKLNALILKIYQPQAHYRIPFSFQRRHTYPIPPYSTIVGFLCNILQVSDDEKFSDYFNGMKIAILGTFKSKSTEYTWFRNLQKDSHKSRFGNLDRKFQGTFEHPGGQMPTYIDILNDVQLWIYIAHRKESLLDELKEKLQNPPKNRVSPLHIGRAEDWIVIQKLKEVELEYREIMGNFGRFFWIPEDNENYENIEGLIYKLPIYYKLRNNQRIFTFKKVKLNNGELKCRTLFDNEEKLPVFFLELKMEDF